MSDPNVAPGQDATSAAAYPVLFEALLGEVPVALADDERAYFAGRVGEATARKEGATVESASVLDACLDAVRTSLPLVAAGKIEGYGPLRMRYLLEIARDLAGEVASFDATVVEAAGAGAAKTTSLRGSRNDRRAALRALKNLAGRGSEERARVRKLGKGDRERPDERARSLAALAGELEGVAAKVPARVAADAGATPALIQRLRGYATAVLETRETAKGARSSVASRYDVMNVLDGRILVELRALRGAMNDARKASKAVPALRIRILDARKGKKKTAPGVEAAPGAGGAPAGQPVG